jgi:hypothetical protein
MTSSSSSTISFEKKLKSRSKSHGQGHESRSKKSSSNCGPCAQNNRPSSSSNCCQLINECNFSGVMAVISFASGVPILTMSGLNGPVSSLLGGCGCREDNLCKQISSLNKFQLVSVAATIGGVVTPIPIVRIPNNSGGQLLAELSPVAGFVAGLPFTISLNNPIVGCQGTVSGITI